MVRQRRRLLSYLVLVFCVLVIYTFLYDWGMSALEDRPRSLIRSLSVVVQTFTTTGYGEDAPWISPEMTMLMIGMQLTGVTLLFLALPLFVAPWVEERLDTTVPTSVTMEDHVVLFGFSSRGETLIEELEAWDRPYVIVESDRDRAVTLLKMDLEVVYGDLESLETMHAVDLESADVIVADATDRRNASIVLTASEVDADIRIIAIAEDAEMVEYLRYAGADEVYTPKQLLGERLADDATTSITTELGDTVEIGSDFELVELPIQAGSEFIGIPLAESGIRERTGANVVGIWDHGEFVPAPDTGHVLEENTILLVTGTASQLESLKQLTHSETRRRVHGTIVIAGFGEVGKTVSLEIGKTGLTGTVVDQEEQSGVDVVGDVTDQSTLQQAGLQDADSIVIALDDDTTTMLATLVVRELSTSIRIVARADEAESVGKLYRAGADYVLALSTVSGRIIASSVLEDEEIIAPDAHLEIIRTSAPELAGHSLDEIDVRSKTGCTVVAVERDGAVITDIGPEFVIDSEDIVIVAGTDEAVNKFTAIAR